MSNKIVITGGHAATTAVAVVEELRKMGNYDIFWIGAGKAIEGVKTKPLESEILPELNVQVIEITTGRIQRKFTRYSLQSLLKIPIGFLESFFHLIRIRPRVILSFGGFASFPVVFVGKILGSKIIIHDQTARAGRANRLASFLADKILLSRSESREFFARGKTKITGNPVMSAIFKVKIKKHPSSEKTIYITGGSRGSQAINRVVFKILPDLLSTHKVIHQTGELDFRKFKKFERNRNYTSFVKINPARLNEVYKRSDIVIGRAGANTVSEVMVIKRPAIFIPLPFSYLDEQTANAEIAKKFGIGRIIPQKTLTPKKLLNEVRNVFEKYQEIIAAVEKKKSPDIGSAKKVAMEIR